MNKILISINPEHVNNILSGIKKYEYRKKAAIKDIHSIIIYSTNPEKKIVAEAEILEVLCETPEKLWKKTKKFSGIDKSFFDNYFNNKQLAYAYKIGNIKIYDKPKELSDFGVKFAPQSYVYIKEKYINLI